jgi:hypothetical protein
MSPFAISIHNLLTPPWAYNPVTGGSLDKPPPAKREPTPRTCECCGATYLSSGATAKYCSPECKRLTEKLRSRETRKTDGDLQCSHCKQMKPIEEFYSHNSRPSGRMAHCKVCHCAICNDRKKAQRRAKKNPAPAPDTSHLGGISRMATGGGVQGGAA